MVVLWTYFKYLKIHLALTYRNISLRFIEAFIQYRTVRHKHCPFSSFLPRMSFVIRFDILLKSNKMRTFPVCVERLTRFWRELTKKHTIFVMSIHWLQKSSCKTQKKKPKNIIQGYINCQSTIKQFSFLFFLNHASAILIKISRKCGYRLS